MSSNKQGWLAVGLLVLLLSAGCREKGAQLQSSATLPDKELFQNGEQWMEKSQYLKARLAFQTLINTYPDGDLASKAYFNIAESFYQEGGKENLLQAEAQYKDFMVFYPKDSKTAEAQLKIAALNMKMMEAPDRDPTYAHKAETELKTFLKKFPEHPLRPEVEEDLKKVQDVLAEGEYGKGNFYYKRKNYKASLARYQDLMKSYPKYGEMDTVMLELADSLIHLNRPEEAVPVLAALASTYEGSKAEAAKKMLTELDKPVPPTDPVLLAEHEGLRKPREPLIPRPGAVVSSLIEPFRGPKDPVKEMQQRHEERVAAGKALAPPAEVADSSAPRPEADIKIAGKVLTGSGPAPADATASPANPGATTNPSNSAPVVTAPTGGGSAPAPDAGNGNGSGAEAVKAGSNNSNAQPDLGNRENPSAPKKKRGLFKRLLRTGN